MTPGCGAVCSGRRLPKGGGGGHSVRGKPRVYKFWRDKICAISEKISEQDMYGPQELLVRNSGRLLLLRAQILENTEQPAYKSFVQKLNRRNSSLYPPRYWPLATSPRP